MAMKCKLCGKGPSFGNVISHANNTRRRRWNPNLQRVHAVIEGVRQARSCLHFLHSGWSRHQSSLTRAFCIGPNWNLPY